MVLDALGSGDPMAGPSLHQMTIAGVPFAGSQHALARKDFVLWGDPTGVMESLRKDACQSTWDVLDENEPIPSFVPAWSLDPVIDVSIDCQTGECLYDADGDGICDELELPEVPWCGDVNATNYGPESLTLQCLPPTVIEYMLSSCCSTAVTSAPPPTATLLPPGGQTSALLSSDCGQGAKNIGFCFEGQRAFVADQESHSVRVLDYSNLNYPEPLILDILPVEIDSAPNGNLSTGTCGCRCLESWHRKLCRTRLLDLLLDHGGCGVDGPQHAPRLWIGAFYDADGKLIDALNGVVNTGPGVSSVHFSDDGRWLVTANRGAGLAAGAGTDPYGSITAVDVSSFSTTTRTPPTWRTLRCTKSIFLRSPRWMACRQGCPQTFGLTLTPWAKFSNPLPPPWTPTTTPFGSIVAATTPWWRSTSTILPPAIPWWQLGAGAFATWKPQGD